MAKANSPVETPAMSKKAAPPKSAGKQTTLFGFFSKAPGAPQASTPSQRRAKSRALPLTPLGSSEIGDEETPVKPVAQKNRKQSSGYQTPVTPDVTKNSDEMDVDSVTGSVGSRKVGLRLKDTDCRNGVLLIMLNRQTTVTRNKHQRNVPFALKLAYRRGSKSKSCIG